MSERPRNKQQDPPRFGHGGARPGAGRPKSPDSGVPHLVRPTLNGREPVYVTLTIREQLFRLRSRPCFETICAAFAEAQGRHGLRVTTFALHGDELRLIAEAADAGVVARGLQALSIRLARGLNRLAGRTGKVFADRYQVRVLRSPREARAALAELSGPGGKVGPSPAAVSRPAPRAGSRGRRAPGAKS